MATLVENIKKMLGECNYLTITANDLKLKYPACDPHNNGKKDQHEFNHEQKDEVVRVINRVLKELRLTEMKDVYRIEQLIAKNFHEWNRDREEAIKWLSGEYPFEQGFNGN
jgi:hypothetical protein